MKRREFLQAIGGASAFTFLPAFTRDDPRLRSFLERYGWL